MNSRIKIESKALLQGNTLKLFLVSAVSFILRYGLISGNAYAFYYVFKSEAEYYYFFIPVLTSALSLVFICAIRLGEQFLYFIKADGEKGRFLLLFKFFKPKDSIKTTVLYLKINFLKFVWLIYFILPAVFLSLGYYYLYKNTDLSEIVSACILSGISALVVAAFTFYKGSLYRYSAAPYYFCLDGKRRVNRAIKKSIHHTDGVLNDGVLFEYSFFGWVLSCVCLLPFFYVVPFIKLSKARFVIEATQQKHKANEVRAPIVFTAYKEAP